MHMHMATPSVYVLMATHNVKSVLLTTLLTHKTAGCVQYFVSLHFTAHRAVISTCAIWFNV
jgi:hypothetical protein